jgi:hypothetical protein
MSKQFNIKGINGLYLTYKPNVTLTTVNYTSQLLFDNDFFPANKAESNLFDLKNVRYQEPTSIIGSNSLQKSNSIYKYSEFSIKDGLIANKMYYNRFTFYFRFYGSTLSGYTLPGINATNTKKILDRLRVKLYVTIGGNMIPMELSNLEKYSGGNWVAVTGADKTSTISTGGYGIELTTGLNSEDCVDMAYTGTTTVNTLFNGYQTAPEKYNFRVSAEFPNFDEVAVNSKTYKLTIRYYNIGVAGTGTYATSEAVELMSNTLTYYEQALSPSSNSNVS